jgi:general stress protein 26
MPKTEAEVREKLYDLAEDAKIAMMTTHNADGTLYTCPMTFQEKDAQGHLWFFLEKDCETARNLQANVNLSLGFSNPGDSEFVSVAGVGQLIEDRAMIEKLWKPVLKAWFPQGKDDPKIALLRVDPQNGQYWDSPSSTLETVVGYVKNVFGANDRGGKMDDNRKVIM